MSSLKRRQFGQLAAASLTSTVVAGLSGKALAQNSELKQGIHGVKLLSTSEARNREDQTPSVELNTAELGTEKVLKILSKANLPVLSVDDPTPVSKKSRAFFVPDYDRITHAITLKDKTLVISTVSNTRKGQFNHLIYSVGSGTNRKFKAKKVRAFKKSDQTVESLLALSNNQLLCLVGTEGIPPFALITLDFQTGKILSGDDLSLPSLPLTHRFGNLCQDLKGNIFATEIGSEGIPILISMNLQDKAIITGKVKMITLNPLTFEGRPLVNDVKDLAFSSSGQLYALAADSSRKNNVLFTVDVKTGKMERVSNFAVDKFTFSL